MRLNRYIKHLQAHPEELQVKPHEFKIPNMAQALRSAKDLDELCRVLNSYNAIESAEFHPDLKLEELVDLGSLPVFDDLDLPMGFGMFSWDETRAIVQTPEGRFEITLREETE